MKIIFRYRRLVSCFLSLFLFLGLTVIFTNCGASHMTQNASSPISLQSVLITPQAAAVSLGKNQQFTATAVFSDGTKKDVTSAAAWSSAQPTVASIDETGIASSKALGTTPISALYLSVKGSSALTVNAAGLVSIAVGPQNSSLTPNHSVQLSASGTFTDGSTQDVSSTVAWSSTPANIVTVNGAGMATAKSLGTAVITATSNNLTGSASVAVVAPILQSVSITTVMATVPLGENEQLSAIGTYNDGSSQDLTNAVQWVSSDNTILGISASGLATADALGSVTVMATSGALNGVAQLQVGPPVVVSMAITPASSVLALGTQEQLSAIAKFSDGSTQDMTASATWTSAESSIADVSAQGLAIARHTGETSISVTSDLVNGSADLTVKPGLAVSYFSNANTSGVADATIRLTNPGLNGGNLCAEIYVFDQDQQLSECCGCMVSPDGLLTLSVNSDLTGNPLTGVNSTNGVIKIVSADMSTSSCDPTAITPDANLLAWSTNIQGQRKSGFAMTETPFQLTALGDSELAALQSQCSFASSLGSGQGTCGCGGTALTATVKR